MDIKEKAKKQKLKKKKCNGCLLLYGLYPSFGRLDWRRAASSFKSWKRQFVENVLVTLQGKWLEDYIHHLHLYIITVNDEIKLKLYLLGDTFEESFDTDPVVDADRTVFCAALWTLDTDLSLHKIEID